MLAIFTSGERENTVRIPNLVGKGCDWLCGEEEAIQSWTWSMKFE